MIARTWLLAGLMATIPTAPALAQPPSADWPCVQIKVAEMSVAAMWDGKPLDTPQADWRGDPALADLVGRLSERRLPIEQAQAMIGSFAAASGPEQRLRLSALLTGLFDVMNQQRAAVLAGLERFARRQRDLAQSLRTGSEKLATLQSATDPDAQQVEQLREQLVWQHRVFDDRRQTLAFVCEVPGKIEQRLFALTRAIRQAAE